MKTTQEKCEEILHKILQYVDFGQEVTFSQEPGGFMAKLQVGIHQTTVGKYTSDSTWEDFVESLHDTLCLKKGPIGYEANLNRRSS